MLDAGSSGLISCHNASGTSHQPGRHSPDHLRSPKRSGTSSKEHTHPDGDVIAAEGELGEEMHLLLDGTVRVVRADGQTIARRGPGEVVGEMSVIRRAPHVATVIAEGDVINRTLDIGIGSSRRWSTNGQTSRLPSSGCWPSGSRR
jgi:hypothetical protein